MQFLIISCFSCFVKLAPLVGDLILASSVISVVRLAMEQYVESFVYVFMKRIAANVALGDLTHISLFISGRYNVGRLVVENTV